VVELLLSKDLEMRRVAKNLYKFDYLDQKELDLLMTGTEMIDKPVVREMDDKLKDYKL
jgi:hypothetical protein